MTTTTAPVLTTLTPEVIHSPQATQPYGPFTPSTTTGPDGWYSMSGIPYWIQSLLIASPLALVSSRNYDLSSQPPAGNEFAKMVVTTSAIPFDDVTKGLIVSSFEKTTQVIDFKFTDTTGQATPGDGTNTIYYFNQLRNDTSFAARSTVPAEIWPETTASPESIQKRLNIDGAVILNSPPEGFKPQVAASVFVHELGHQLGLTHPFEGFLVLPQGEDFSSNSIMSYQGNIPYSVDYTWSPLDVAALQYLYGPSKSVRTGNDSYTINPNSNNFLWDGVGTNTVDASNLTSSVDFSLAPGYWGFVGTQRGQFISSPGQITVNYHSLMQNAIGSSQADHITGNEQNNTINGGAGNDRLGGNEGNDSLIGGAGIDTALFNHPASHYTISINNTPNQERTVSVQDHTVSQPLPTLPALENTLASFMGANMPSDLNEDLDTNLYQSSYYHIDRSTGTLVYGDPLANPPLHYRPIMSDGTDSLATIERIEFSDKKIAIDFAPGQAGEQAARLIGAVLGKAQLSNTGLVSAALGLYDAGMTTTDISTALVNNGSLAVFLGGGSDEHVLASLYKNVIGRDATASEMTELLPLVQEHGQAWLLTAAAALDQTAVQIDLVGLSQTGLAFA